MCIRDRAHFKPEFLNRLDDTVVFEPLSREELARIVDLQVDALASRLAARRITLQVTDAARVGARAASRGESGIEVRRQVYALAPDGADVDVRRRGRSVTVTVSSRARGPAAWFPGLHPDSSATARLEPGVR